MDSLQPIGIFDSGVGGLTVVRFVFKYLPFERIIYFGDTAHVPYGSRTPNEIIKFGDQIVSFLLKFGVKAVVAACNTSSSLSLSFLQKKYSVPILGVIKPAVKAALRVTSNKRIGLIATEATVRSGAYDRNFLLCDRDVKVFSQACPLFVPLVEEGKIETGEAYQIARQYLEPLRDSGIDTLVLGCTHYPYLSPVISKILGPEVTLVDPAEETVKELVFLLGENTSGENKLPQHRFFVSGSAASFYKVGQKFLNGFPFTVEKVSLEGRKRLKYAGGVYSAGVEG